MVPCHGMWLPPNIAMILTILHSFSGFKPYFLSGGRRRRFRAILKESDEVKIEFATNRD
jgi:hypothetical protein